MKLLLFDVDGTLAESGQKINDSIIRILKLVAPEKYQLGIVGGGKLDKILTQLNNEIFFNHYFSECGCIYNQNKINNRQGLELTNIYQKDIRKHSQYLNINILIKDTLKFLSSVEYNLTGHFIDLRSGIIYISLIGMAATQQERKQFLDQDQIHNYRENLLELLITKEQELNKDQKKIDIVYGGSVGISIYPSEYDKVQVLEHLDIKKYEEIHYFGDKYLENGNDYQLLNSSSVIGHPVDCLEDTQKELQKLLNQN
tara:strand:+ start:223 stop:990 length:768 start_codon:yes stop_codon:yes gene_type:complete